MLMTSVICPIWAFTIGFTLEYFRLWCEIRCTLALDERLLAILPSYRCQGRSDVMIRFVTF